MWGRLGYPRRALRLHEAAQAIVDRHGGEVPAELDELLALPGVGAYTARAVASFAYGRRHPVVDTNVRRVVARAVLGQGDAGPPSTARDLAAVAALLPADPARAARFGVALDGAGRAGLHGPHAALRGLPGGRRRARGGLAGSPPYDGPVPRPQRFAGTDRQVRGLLLDVLRAADGPVPAAALDAVWSLDAQRARALDGLVADGLVDPLPDGRFALPGLPAAQISTGAPISNRE